LGRGLGWVTHRGLCQPRPCWDSVILLCSPAARAGPSVTSPCTSPVVADAILQLPGWMGTKREGSSLQPPASALGEENLPVLSPYGLQPLLSITACTSPAVCGKSPAHPPTPHAPVHLPELCLQWGRVRGRR